LSEERRIATRVDTQPGSFVVLDRISETSLGTIANISSTGFMLVTNRFIDTDSVFQLNIGCGSFDISIDIGAICLWTTEASSADSFWSGFHIIDISDSSQADLDIIVEKISV
jgi:hypothetical protein